MKINKVYILEYTPNCEERLIYGVFKSRQLAEEYKSKFSKYAQYDLEIYEYKLDVLTNEVSLWQLEKGDK